MTRRTPTIIVIIMLAALMSTPAAAYEQARTSPDPEPPHGTFQSIYWHEPLYDGQPVSGPTPDEQLFDVAEPKLSLGKSAVGSDGVHSEALAKFQAYGFLPVDVAKADLTVDFIVDNDSDRRPDRLVRLYKPVGADEDDDADIQVTVSTYTGDRFDTPATLDDAKNCSITDRGFGSESAGPDSPVVGWGLYVHMWNRYCLTDDSPDRDRGPIALRLLSVVATATIEGQVWRDVTPNDPRALAPETTPDGTYLAPAADASPKATATARDTSTVCPDDVGDHGFSDVYGTTHEGAIACLAWWGITTGKTSDTYDPHGYVTEPQMASFMVRLAEAAGAPIADAPYTYRYAAAGVHQDAIDRLVAFTAIEPADRHMQTSSPMPRMDMALWMRSMYESLTGAPMAVVTHSYFDDPDGDGFTHDQLGTVGVATGTEPRRFGGSEPMTRGQMASFLLRLLDRVADEDPVYPNRP